MEKFKDGNGQLHTNIRKILKANKSMKPYEIQSALGRLHGIFISESNVTRRLREMKDVEAKRPKKMGSWDYSLL